MAGHSDGDVVILVNGKAISGWTEVSISGGLDMVPSLFELSMTERYPSSSLATVLKPGDACSLTIGGDLVLTGYINRYEASVRPREHTIRLSGRSLCQDLVDCSARPEKLQINTASIGQVAAELLKPFAGIKLQMPDGDGLGKSYVVNVTLGETPWEIISGIAQYEGLLVHDDARGDLVICKVGKTAMASGFAEGVNLQAFSHTRTDDSLYSEYIPVLNAQDSLAAYGKGSNYGGAIVTDPTVLRERPLIIISPQMNQGGALAEQMALWEATRRRGRSHAVTVTADSWRDSAGKLWTHNMLAPVQLPSIHITGVSWIIAGWHFKRDEQDGTTCEITLMPPEAFAVQPSALDAVLYQQFLAEKDRSDEAAATTLGDRNPGAGTAITAPNALTDGARSGPSQNVRAGEGYGL